MNTRAGGMAFFSYLGPLCLHDQERHAPATSHKLPEGGGGLTLFEVVVSDFNMYASMLDSLSKTG